MINKEIILGNGNIVKDFMDRNIPQNSHNQVCVSFLIPSNQFNDYDDFSVFTGVSRIVGGSETTLNSLVLTASKSITIEGINYIKFSCVLSIDYTNVIGELRFSPYIQGTRHTDSVLEDSDSDGVDEVITETLLDQYSYTNCKLNIIKAVRIQEDASLEEASIATTLAGQINSKKIYYNAEWNSISNANVNQLYYNIANGYNPSISLYNGSIVAIKNQNVVSFYFPYLNDSAVELLKMTNDGLFYKISGISRTGDAEPYTYNATIQQITESKSYIDNALDTKVDKTTKVNNHALSEDITITKGDVELGNVVNYGVESTPTSSGSDLYITSKGVYDALQLVYSALNGYATTSDLSAINTRLESVESIIGSDDGDADSVINTLKEVIVVLNGLGEGANLLDLINAKANQSDLTALSGVVNAMGLKVDVLYDANANAYMEIKAQSGTIDILTTDWVDNADSYASDYPYKWELSNGYLVGASNVIVVFSVDSDTSLLSTSVAIDDTNGNITLYASDIPSDTISIEKIAVFNNVNAYINYSQTIVSQVNANTDAINDINNTKLPQYVKGSKSYTISGASLKHEIKYSDIDKSLLLTSEYKDIGNGIIRTSEFALNQYGRPSMKLSNIGYSASVDLSESGFAVEINDNGTIHELTFDENGALKIDGTAVGGGGGHKVIKCFNQAIEPYTLNGQVVGGVWCITAEAIGYGVATDTATGNTPTSWEAGDIVLGYSQVEHGTFGDPDFYTEDILNRVLVVNEQIQSGDVLLQFQQMAQYSESRMLTTATTPTDTAGVLTLSASDVNEGGGKVGDYISYISSGSISALYKITAVNYVNDAFVYTIDLVGNIGGGKQLYQHNIMIEGQIANTSFYIRGMLTIINDINLPFVKTSEYIVGTNQDLPAWLNTKGFIANGLSSVYNANLYANDGSLYQGIGSENAYFYTIANQNLAKIQIVGSSVTDTIIPL